LSALSSEKAQAEEEYRQIETPTEDAYKEGLS
jgi:hypothetical protein